MYMSLDWDDAAPRTARSNCGGRRPQFVAAPGRSASRGRSNRRRRCSFAGRTSRVAVHLDVVAGGCDLRGRRHMTNVRHAPASLLRLSAAVCLLAGGIVAAAAPPPLSADTAPANVESTYGSGSFGTWHVDAAGLPAFRYQLDETADTRASQPELNGGTEAQHQVGNDHIVAAAFNHGYTQLWSQDRLQQWAKIGRAHV